MIDINWKPTDRQLRQFGLAFLVAGLLVGGMLWWRLGENRISPVLWGLGPVVALVGWFAPRALKPLYIGLTVAAYPIGMVIGTVLMALTYYLMVTPIALVFRLIGRDPLNRRYDPQAESYWIRRPPQTPARRYFQQF